MIIDLKQRGLLDETLVMCTSESAPTYSARGTITARLAAPSALGFHRPCRSLVVL